MLSALATAAGSTPSGTWMSMWSAKGTRTQSAKNPPQPAPPSLPRPYMEPRGTALQLAVMPREQRAQTPQEIWNGTTARWPGRTRLTRATDLEHLAHPLVPEWKWAGERP